MKYVFLVFIGRSKNKKTTNNSSVIIVVHSHYSIFLFVLGQDEGFIMAEISISTGSPSSPRLFVV